MHTCACIMLIRTIAGIGPLSFQVQTLKSTLIWNILFLCHALKNHFIQMNGGSFMIFVAKFLTCWSGKFYVYICNLAVKQLYCSKGGYDDRALLFMGGKGSLTHSPIIIIFFPAEWKLSWLWWEGASIDVLLMPNMTA